MTQRLRRLSKDEARLWARVARTVAPLPDKPMPDAAQPAKIVPAPAKKAITPVRPAPPAAPPRSAPRPAPPRPLDRHGLDGSWERKLTHGTLAPDFTLDLHGHGLDGAHARLDTGLSQALTMGARVVLVITGRPRPVEAADRSSHRGAIRAKLIDWLAEGSYASRIATVRAAHRRHGGAGAVYVILKRPR